MLAEVSVVFQRNLKQNQNKNIFILYLLTKSMKQIKIPKDIVKQLCTINAAYELQGIIMADHSNPQLYNKILVRYDSHPDNTVCKMNDIIFDTVCFHTHPKECYEMFKTTKGWPSVYDIESFLQIEKIRIMFVISIEGIYVLIKKQDKTKHLLSGMRELYKNAFKKVGDSVLSEEQYIEQLNKHFNNDAKVHLVSRDKLEDFHISFV